MHPLNVETALETMTILVDTREQDTDFSQRRYKAFGTPYRRQKINAGDYGACFVIRDNEEYVIPVVVERKMSLDELCMCFCSNRDRFEREFIRAREDGIKVYLLIENGSWEKILKHEYRSKMNPNALFHSLLSYMARFNCRVVFCEPRTSGQLIKEILRREAKEILLNLEEE